MDEFLAFCSFQQNAKKNFSSVLRALQHGTAKAQYGLDEGGDVSEMKDDDV